MSNKQVIREFIQVWSSLDAERIGSFFVEDGVYHNMPAQPVTGRANIVAFIKSFTASWKSTEWELLTIIEDDDVVVAERIDRTDFGNKKVDLPCLGIFEMQNGKIRVWRDYFDLNTYLK